MTGANDLPHGVFEMIAASGIFGRLIVLLTLASLALFLFILASAPCRRPVHVLIALGSACVMLGILGTAAGLLSGFGVLADRPTANMSDLAGMIYIALSTTVMGLLSGGSTVTAGVFLLAFRSGDDAETAEA